MKRANFPLKRGFFLKKDGNYLFRSTPVPMVTFVGLKILHLLKMYFNLTHLVTKSRQTNSNFIYSMTTTLLLKSQS